jgi:uncharacterized protein
MRILSLMAFLFGAGTAVAAPELPKRTQVPDGFVEMIVAGVLATDNGQPAVILRDKSETKLLPIWIGIPEAQAIQLRLERRKFERPLTHDLLDSVMQGLGGKLMKIQVEELKGDTYVGTMFVKTEEGVRRFDARPSDMIALALGNQVPIFVSKEVLESASGTVEREPEDAPASDLPPGIKTL